MYIFGRVKHGQFQPQRFFKKDLENLEGKEVEVRKVESSRSSQQNRYLWGVIYRLVSEYTGFTDEEVHETFKRRFLTYTKEVNGRVYEFVKSTADLKVSDFSEYVEKVKTYAQSELGLIIPDPEVAYEET